ncbi:ATP-binding cassette domain-containing protein [Bifidobacterium subtile]|jgi:putative ABC transport system ATP-binding protein|uniref:ATP-binding cassette domain-containing protein n=1 Tax=Bifidobacterium subtile TaxID=77635 RepID=UPI002F35BB4A
MSEGRNGEDQNNDDDQAVTAASVSNEAAAPGTDEREHPAAMNDSTERDTDMSEDSEARDRSDTTDSEDEDAAKENRTVQFSVVFDDDEDGDFAIISGDGTLTDDDSALSPEDQDAVDADSIGANAVDEDVRSEGNGAEAGSAVDANANASTSFEAGPESDSVADADTGAEFSGNADAESVSAQAGHGAAETGQFSYDVESSDARGTNVQNSAAQNATNADHHSSDAAAGQLESSGSYATNAPEAAGATAADYEESENAASDIDIAARNAERVEATLGLAQSQATIFPTGTSTRDAGADSTERIASRLDREIISRRDDTMLLKAYPNFALDHLTVTNRKTGRSVLDDVDMAFHAGRLYAIFVDDEEQRTTLMAVMGGFIRADSGQVLLKSANINELEIGEIRGHRIGMVPQRFALREDLDAVANLVYAMDASGRTFLKPKPVVARDLLSQVGCEDIHAGVPVRELPEVDRRRMAIARAISCEASVIIIDAPTAGLDDAQTQEILSLLTAISRSRNTRRSVIMLTSSDADCEAADAVYDVDE